MLVAFGVVGVAAAAVLAPPGRSWRAAAEHSRGFWLAWIVGFAALGFGGPATVGLGWAPTAWLAVWSAVGALQPSMVADLVEVRRFTRRRLAVVPARGPTVAAAPRVRGHAPAANRVPPGGVLTGR
jgi:hypothetical protein